jgi:hypothetical protein
MGELDLTKICGAYNPSAAGYQSAFLTVMVSWLPLAVAGIALSRTRVVHATMRGAGPLRLLSWLAITILAAAMAMSPMIAAIVVGLIWPGEAPPLDFSVVLPAILCAMVPIAALDLAGLIAWHRVLVALASREGDGRMLV